VFLLPNGTCGVLVAGGDEVVGMDLFDWPGTFGQLWDRLAGAYALGALRESEPTELTRPKVAQQFLRRVGFCIRSVVPVSVQNLSRAGLTGPQGAKKG
jgi:hypothetical protein